MTRLASPAWPQLVRAGVAAAYERGRIETGIVHLGIGAFARAFVADYTEAALAAGDARWGIVGVSLRHADAHARLAPQDGLYTLLERDGAALRARVMGALTGVLVAPRQPREVMRCLTDPRTRIVTLTITEKGYGFDAAGHLDTAAPDIAHDLRAPHEPSSAVGFIAAALVARRAAGAAPFAVLSCDNLRDNGRSLRRLVLEYAQLAFPDAARWIEEAVAFPNAMVDRIVPRALPQDHADARAAHGYDDAAPVRCEPFAQWVIERFDGARPEWEAAGAQFVADVRPFEDAKLRLLNAAHTALAIFGVLLGHATIAEAAADADIAAYVRALMQQELAPTVAADAALDVADYQRRLWPRFANTALGHGTLQVAMDTSLKLTQRHVPVLRERLARGQPIDRLALLIAGWIRYLAGQREDGSAYKVDDPLAPQLVSLAARQTQDPAGCVRKTLAVAAVFGTLGADAVFAARVTQQFTRLLHLGVRAALR
jgi:fructuronate reductase